MVEKGLVQPDPTEKTLFAKIIDKEIPAEFIHEDDLSVAFMDKFPQAPFHALVLPKKKIPRLAQAEDTDRDVLGHLLIVTKKLAAKNNLEKGFRVVINDGVDACQSVYHLHVHLLGKRKLGWPPG